MQRGPRGALIAGAASLNGGVGALCSALSGAEGSGGGLPGSVRPCVMPPPPFHLPRPSSGSRLHGNSVITGKIAQVYADLRRRIGPDWDAGESIGFVDAFVDRSSFSRTAERLYMASHLTKEGKIACQPGPRLTNLNDLRVSLPTGGAHPAPQASRCIVRLNPALYRQFCQAGGFQGAGPVPDSCVFGTSDDAAVCEEAGQGTKEREEQRRAEADVVVVDEEEHEGQQATDNPSSSNQRPVLPYR